MILKNFTERNLCKFEKKPFFMQYKFPSVEFFYFSSDVSFKL